jgi:thiol-disulfide isomerase/thioredoxin
MKKLFATLLLGALAASAQLKLPRPAPELTINLPKSSPILLCQYKGKVTVVEFLFTTCPHCQHASQLMTRLQTEYGAKGFQAVGVAFNDMANMLVSDFSRDFRVNYPVGFTNRETVYSFLQNDPNMSLHVPQIVIIDRKGMIRHQSLPREDSTSATEPFLRKNIEALLSEPAGPAKKPAGAKKPAAKKAAS